MPQPVDKLKRVLKNITAGGNVGNRKATKFLNFHPKAPKNHQNKKIKSYQPKPNSVQNLKSSEISPIDAYSIVLLHWQMQHDQKEKLYEAERECNEKLQSEILHLKNQLSSQNELLREFGTRLVNKNTTFQQILQYCLAHHHHDTVDKATETESDEHFVENKSDGSIETIDIAHSPGLPDDSDIVGDSAVQNQVATVTISTHVDTAHTETAESDNVIGVDSANSTNGSSKAKAKKQQRKNGSMQHVCPDCGFSTNKKSTLVDHQAEFCVREPVRDFRCNICQKEMTRRELRIHLNGYIRNIKLQKHKPTGAHGPVPLDEHIRLRDALKTTK